MLILVHFVGGYFTGDYLAKDAIFHLLTIAKVDQSRQNVRHLVSNILAGRIRGYMKMIKKLKFYALKLKMGP